MLEEEEEKRVAAEAKKRKNDRAALLGLGAEQDEDFPNSAAAVAVTEGSHPTIS